MAVKRILGLRVVRWYYKLAYAVVGVAITSGLGRLSTLIHIPTVVWSPIGALLLLALFVVGARCFRGPGEDIAAPRPWWRMTNRSKSSKWLGVLFVILGSFVLLGVILRVVAPVHDSVTPLSPADEQLSSVALYATLGFLYLTSATRLRSMETDAASMVVTADGKREYLVVFDYGVGREWGLIHARDENDLHQKFPELTIAPVRSSSMSQRDLNRLRKHGIPDIDDAPIGIFLTVTNRRSRTQPS